MKKRKIDIDIDIVALEFFCNGVSMAVIARALGVPVVAIEDWIRERVNYLHSEKP